MHKETEQLIVTLIFVTVLILLINPFYIFFMPTELVYIILGAILVLFGVYLSFIVFEQPQDERERLHRYVANHTAYLWGSTILVVGIVYQGITAYTIDTWLLLVLGVMVVSKVLSLIHSKKHK